MKFERFPIHRAKFLQEGTSVLIGSLNYAFCHSYDLMTGKTIKIPLPHGITNMKVVLLILYPYTCHFVSLFSLPSLYILEF
jgi:hypothetical protein